MQAETILRVARGEIGTTENPAGSNRQKYGEAYGLNGAPWCVIFCWWCFQEAGASGLFYGGGKTASCSQYIAWAKKAGQWITGGFQPGDLVFFDFNPSAGDGVDHVGIVESWDGQTLVTIEGNTSLTSDDNGGAVMRRTDHGKYAVGAARPAYSPKEEDEEMTVEQFKDLWLEMRRELQDNDAGAWSEAARKWAVDTGLIEGGGTLPDGTPNYMWADMLTREQMAVLLHRLAQKMGMA